MACWFTLVALFFFAVPRAVLASPCIAFNANFNLLVFGLGGKDFNAGPRDAWTTDTNAKEITRPGRPQFDGTTTSCYLSQFANAIYVLGADSENPSAIYIYDAARKSWSTQEVEPGSFDPNSFNAVLDRDTNVFYAISHGKLFLLNMSNLRAATSSALSWNLVREAPLPDGYRPVMALAQNHIHFLNVPGAPAGSAKIFVIHYSYFQPESQLYPASGGDSFPAAHGQVTSFFQEEEVQQEFAFVPDDGVATYVVNVVTNSTRLLPSPPAKDSRAIYCAGLSSLVQLDSTGAVSFIPYKQEKSASPKWQSIASIHVAASPIANKTTDHKTDVGGSLPATNQRNQNGANIVAGSSAWSLAAMALFLLASFV